VVERPQLRRREDCQVAPRAVGRWVWRGVSFVQRATLPCLSGLTVSVRLGSSLLASAHGRISGGRSATQPSRVASANGSYIIEADETEIKTGASNNSVARGACSCRAVFSAAPAGQEPVGGRRLIGASVGGRDGRFYATLGAVGPVMTSIRRRKKIGKRDSN